MGILDKLLGKKQPEEETIIVSDGCTIMLGDTSRKATAAFRAKGVRPIINAWSGSFVKDLTWPEGLVNNLTVCKNHAIPIGVINYDKWYGQVLTSAALGTMANKPEVQTTCAPSEKVGMILMHWTSVDKQTCMSALEKLEKGLVEWS